MEDKIGHSEVVSQMKNREVVCDENAKVRFTSHHPLPTSGETRKCESPPDLNSTSDVRSQ